MSAVAVPIKAMIEKKLSFGSRTVAWLLGFNKNTVQRIFRIKGWQIRKRPVGMRPWVVAVPSVAAARNERWATDLCRVYAGQVVVELVRIAEATGEPPSVNAARRLVAYNHHEHFRTGAPDGARRAVEKAFRRFQSSAHLQAVMILKRSLLKELEGSEEKCREFLGTARAVESFVDNNVVSDSFKWNPLRVPETIEKVSKIDFPRLSDRELKAAGVT
jgi:hypothetical protein